MDDPVTARVCGWAEGAAAEGFLAGGPLEDGTVVGSAVVGADVWGAGGLDAVAASGGCSDCRAECVLNPSSNTSPATVATIAASARFIRVRLEGREPPCEQPRTNTEVRDQPHRGCCCLLY